MEAKINKQKEDRGKIPTCPHAGDLPSKAVQMTNVKKVGTAHLSGRISELSVFGLLWG